MNTPPIDPKCAARHVPTDGYLMRPDVLNQMLAAYRGGTLPVNAAEPPNLDESDERDDPFRGRGYTKHGDIAHIAMDGVMMRGSSKFGGTCNTLAVRLALRQAGRDPEVGGVLLTISSPGGAVTGTEDLARDLAKLAETKPVHVHGEGEGINSAAYYVASQASHVSAAPGSYTGSIGVYAVVVDDSGRYEAEGLRTVVVSTGEDKGRLSPGQPVDDDDVAYVRSYVEDSWRLFRQAILRGRRSKGMDADVLKAVSGGKTWLPDQALELGLIDSVGDVDAAAARLGRVVRKRQRDQQERSRRVQRLLG